MGVIYKIVSKDKNITNKFYIGSTNDLYTRIKFHKYCYNCVDKRGDTNLYKFMKTNGGWDNYSFEIIKDDVEYKLLRFYERIYYESFDKENLINKNIPLVIDDNEKRLRHNIANKIYYQKHREKIRIKQKEKIYCKMCDLYITRNHWYKHIQTQRHCRNCEIINK
jgi:hypothetical protein